MMDYKELIKKLREKDGCNCECLQAADTIETLLAERDALYRLVKRRFWSDPEECSRYGDCYKKAYDDMRMLGCPSCKNWQWRGPQNEDNHEAD